MSGYKVFAIKFLAFFSGCFLCCCLQRDFGCSPVLASAIVGFIGSFYDFTVPVEKTGIQAVIYAGSFAGMCSLENLPNLEHICMISLIGTAVYFLLKPRLVGFGGKLGTVALIASIIVVFSRGLW